MSDSNNTSINDDSSNNSISKISNSKDSKDSKDMKRTDSDLDGKPSTDFGIKFRRVRACARCHRLKMRCVFEDPTFNSCKRCYAANIACSMTEDPTSSTAKTRTRRRLKAPLANLQNSMSEAFNFFQKVQEQLNDNTINKTNKKIFNNKDKHNDNDNDNDNDSDNDKDNDDNKDIITIPDSFEIDKLTQIQSQLFELQRLLSHVISSSKTAQNISPKSNVASSMSSMKDGPVKPVPHLPWIPYEYNIMKELFKLKILSPGISREKYNIFVNDILIYWPCISLPKDYTFEYLLEREPLILLGFIAVTCLNQPDLHDTLLYYLEGNLAQRVSISGDITVNLIQIYLVLSLWGSPPRKWGSYKHQMSLLTALDLSLCLDLGNEKFRDSSNVLKSNSEERKIIRAYIGVYTCCGSLGLSLPRFKVVSWTKNHEKCCNILLTGESNRQDKFLCYYARLISIGEEIFSFLCPDAIGGPNAMAFMNMNNANNTIGNDIISNGPVTNTSWSHEHLRTMMIGYEKRMQKLAIASELLNHDSKERNLLSIIYYQLLMTMYDYVVCRVLMKRDVLNEVYIETLSRLIRASEKVIDSFVNLCDQTDYFPTFFYYRPMHALVALIRARLLVRSQRLDLEVNVEREYDRVCSSLDTISKKSLVANKMKAILSRVDKWMKVSNKFSKDGANSSMVTLLDELGKEKAIEVIKVTKTKKAAAAVAAAAAAATAAAGSSSSGSTSTLLTEISNSNTISANSKNAGDNGNLHPGAKAHFNKFIHHNFDSVSQMKRTHSTANQPSTGAANTTSNDGSSSTTTSIKSNKQQKKDSKHTPNSSSSTSGATSTVLSTSTSSTSENSTPVKSVNNTSRGANTTTVTPLSSRSNTNNKSHNNQSRSRSSNIDRPADSSQVQQQQPQQQQSQQSQQQQNYQNFIPSPIGYTYSEYAPSPLMQTRSNSINAINNGNNGNGNGGNGGNNRINKSVQNLSQLPSDQISQVRQDSITANQQQAPLLPPQQQLPPPPPPPQQQQQFEDTSFNNSDIPPQTPSNLLNDDHFTAKSLADIFMQIDSDIINFMASSNNNSNYSNMPQGDIPPSQFQQNYQQQQNMDSGQQGNNSQSNLFNSNYIGDFQNIDNGFYQNEYNSNFMNYNNFNGNNNNEEGDGGLPPPPPPQQQQQTAPQQGQSSQRQGPSDQLPNGEYFMVSQNTDTSSNNDNKNIFGEVEGYGFW